jgi:hypothetical protein
MLLLAVKYRVPITAAGTGGSYSPAANNHHFSSPIMPIAVCLTLSLIEKFLS